MPESTPPLTGLRIVAHASGVAAAYAMLILVISIAFTLFFLYALRVPKGARI